MSYKSRRRWALIILLVGLPVYIVASISILGFLDRPPIWVELLVYTILGILWAVPFKSVFKGIGKEDPDA